MRPLTIALSILALIWTSCADDEPGATPTPTFVKSTAITTPGALPLIDLSYGEGILRVEVASTPDERSKGLGGRESLAADAGMLFDLGETRVPTFSMRDTLIALDFIWIDENRRIQGIVTGVQPVPAGEPLAPYSPSEPVRYVLEVNGGSAERLGLEAGDQLEFVLP